ncbi:alpha/beta hydrolase [Flavobacterium sp. RHBU_24]|uniref:alpha/beta hydrolase n=1 Tax=Flavobacterium sp. RHBU_24 TaxID=3391185 RepID=UPI00398533F4
MCRRWLTGQIIGHWYKIAENDVLPDEGEAYARKLDQAGVPVTVIRYIGLVRDYGLLAPRASVPPVQTAVRQAAAVIKNTLK